MADLSANYISELDATYPPGSEASSVADDSFRTVKRALQNTIRNGSVPFVLNAATTGSTSAALTLTCTPPVTAYVDGLAIRFICPVDIAASATVKVDALGAVSLLESDGTAVAANSIKTGEPVTITYYSGSFRLSKAPYALVSAVEIPSTTKMLFYENAAPTGWTIDSGITTTGMVVVDHTNGGTAGGTDDPKLMDKVPAHTHTTDDPGNHSHTYWNKTGYENSTSSNTGGSFVTKGAWTGTSNQSGAINADGGSHSHTTITQSPVGSNWVPRFNAVIVCSKN